MTTYTQKTLLGTFLTPAAAQTLITIPGATKGLFHRVEVKNHGIVQGNFWLYRGASALDAQALGLSKGLPGKQTLNLAEGISYMIDAGGLLLGRCDYADFGTENAAVLTTAEISVAAAAAITYAATTVTDTGAAYTASPNNADLVGRRIEAGGVAYMICTSNTATVITGSAGWFDITTGLPYLNAANGNLFPTSGGAGMAYKVLASMRDTRETGLPVNVYVGHLLETGAYNARRQVRLIGNNAGIATYGTTFQVIVGGWPTGLPTAGKMWSVDSLISVMCDWVEES